MISPPTAGLASWRSHRYTNCNCPVNAISFHTLRQWNSYNRLLFLSCALHEWSSQAKRVTADPLHYSEDYFNPGRGRHRVVRRRCYHTFYTTGSDMDVRLLALRTGRPSIHGGFLVLIFLRWWANLRAIVRMEGLGDLKNPVTSMEIEQW
jgi:hypothetical protein